MPSPRPLQAPRALSGSLAGVLGDILLPTVLFYLLEPAGLPATVRLGIGGFALGAKASAYGVPRRPQRERLLRAVVLAAGASGVALACLALGLGASVSVAAGGAVVGTATAIQVARGRHVDGFALAVLAEIAASVLLTAILRDPRFLLARPSVYTAIAALYVLATLRSPQPFVAVVSKPIAAAGNPDRAAAFDAASTGSPRFRRAERAMTAVLGLVLLSDAISRATVVLLAHRPDTGLVPLYAQLPGFILLTLYVIGVRLFAVPVVSQEVDRFMPETSVTEREPSPCQPTSSEPS